MESNKPIIILSLVCFVLLSICCYLGYQSYQVNKSLELLNTEFSKLKQNPHDSIREEFEAKDLYDTAAQTYLTTFNYIDSAFKAESQSKDRLSDESFYQVFQQSYTEFNRAIKMAEKVLNDYPNTYYRNKIAIQGLFISGNFYPIPVLRENRDSVLQKFMVNRGESIAYLIKEDCKIIDKSITQFAMDKQSAGGSEIKWEDIVPYLPPDSRLATSNGNDIYGNPFSLGTINPQGSSLKISPETIKKFSGSKFDWGSYAPETP